jgi:hypothetical protein
MPMPKLSEKGSALSDQLTDSGMGGGESALGITMKLMGAQYYVHF